MRTRGVRRSIVVGLLGWGLGCESSPPAPPPPEESAAVRCFDHAKQISNLTLDGRISLCAGATDADAPIRCFHASSRHHELGLRGRVHLCSASYELSPFTVIEQTQRNAEALDALKAQLTALQRTVAETARATPTPAPE